MSIISILHEVQDPRDPNARHALPDILFVTLAATLCGARNCVEVSEFTEGHLEDLQEIVPLEYGAPSHDTFSRVFRLLDPAELSRAVTAFMAALRSTFGLPPPSGVVAIDGKALRRGYETGKSHFPPLMVSVWDSETRLTIASARAPGGSEVKATLDLLKGLDLKGCTVTAAALHCNAATAEAVLASKAQYALGLKGNHGPLFAAAERGFAAADDLASFETREQGHGRREWRRTSVLPISRVPNAPAFPGLKAIGRIEAERTVGKSKPETTVRYAALSKVLSPQKLAQVIRAHWSIENELHWQLDVAFDEDDARTRKDNGPENLAVIRRLAHNILRAHPRPGSVASKMRRANWSKEFFFEVFAHMR
jgi:predicted transposase YbfD/YdcC